MFVNFFLHLYGIGNLNGKICRLNHVLIEYFELFKANELSNKDKTKVNY